MPGEGHALQRQPDAPADLHVEDRQRQRDARLALDHVVEIAVARIVVLDVVAGEADFLEQVAVDRGQARRQVQVAVELRAQRVGIGIDLGGVAGGVEVGVLVAGDQQGGVEQRQLVVAERGQRVPVGQGGGRSHHDDVVPVGGGIKVLRVR